MSINHNKSDFEMNTVLSFGKHKGKTIKQLFDSDEEDYIYWMYSNFNATFSKDIEDELEARIAENEDIARSFMWGID